jgi:hypothetical protein
MEDIDLTGQMFLAYLAVSKGSMVATLVNNLSVCLAATFTLTICPCGDILSLQEPEPHVDYYSAIFQLLLFRWFNDCSIIQNRRWWQPCYCFLDACASSSARTWKHQVSLASYFSVLVS